MQLRLPAPTSHAWGGYPKWVNGCILSPDDLAARNFDRVFFGWDCG